MKISIKAKILIGTSLVVIVSLIICGSIVYTYFVNILRKQVIKDDSARLNQTKRHMEYIVDDITRFSYNIALDPDVQDFLSTKNWNNYMDKLWSIDRIRARLANFKYLREYIQCAIIIRMDGTVCTNDKAFDDYARDSLEEEWFRKYKINPSHAFFSDPHIIQGERSSMFNVISYITEVKNIDNPTQPIGYIVFNIYLDHFEKSIKPESEGFDAYLWFGRDNTVIYEKNAEKYSIKPALLSECAVTVFSYNSFFYKQKNGYVILSAPMSNGWQLASFTLHSTLLKKTNYILLIFIIFIFASLFLTILIMLPIVLGITKPITDLTRAMSEVSGGNMDINLKIKSGDEVQILSNGFSNMIQELKSYITKSIEFEKTKRDMEFNLLLSQINPHFIYNTLNTVIYLAKKNRNDDIARMMDSFIRILQDAVKINEEGIYATVRQEIDVAKHYVTIQRYRYPERFSMVWNICDEVMDAQVPRTILQPLIENALVHGIFPSERMGEIRVTILRQRDELFIEVYDNGIGIDDDTIQHVRDKSGKLGYRSVMRSIGIPNIIDRIRYLYGNEYGLSIESNLGEWTKVTIRIPFSL